MADHESLDQTNLLNCYKQIADLIKSAGSEYVPEREDVIKAVDSNRRYWRPTALPKVILLAESHVYTSDLDFESALNYPSSNNWGERPAPPKEFARLVYCLGYGENVLLSKSIQANAGTWQFWKIFMSCCRRIESNDDFGDILKTCTKAFNCRFKNKTRLLEHLRSRGVWLLDASITAIYGSPWYKNRKLCNKIIKKSWDCYIYRLLEKLKPEAVIIIGKGVGGVVEKEVRGIYGIEHVEVLPQPQAHLTKAEHMRNWKRCYDICKEYAPETDRNERKTD